jgi:hypothetical protein
LIRYQRVISLKTHAGITNQRNKWANTVHPPRHTGGWIVCLDGLSIPSLGQTRLDPSFMTMNADLSIAKFSV